MTQKSHRIRQRLLLVRRDIAHFTALEPRPNAGLAGSRQPSKFSLLLIVALTAIAVIAAISAIQLIEAALG